MGLWDEGHDKANAVERECPAGFNAMVFTEANQSAQESAFWATFN